MDNERKRVVLERAARIESKWDGVTDEQFRRRIIADAIHKGHIRAHDDETPPPASLREIIHHRQEMIRIDGWT